mmetsp:Transcript_2184/g.4971  ORF Transcript_2184/g.4971 Transcript_2184/m.4971 type:complete len:538 (+) Transcript_2184:50-1663(+)
MQGGSWHTTPRSGQKYSVILFPKDEGRQFEWHLSMQDRDTLLHFAQAWCVHSPLPLGALDRSSFCRLMLDSGLLNPARGKAANPTTRVCYHWIGALFDDLTCPQTQDLSRVPALSAGQFFVAIEMIIHTYARLKNSKNPGVLLPAQEVEVKTLEECVAEVNMALRKQSAKKDAKSLGASLAVVVDHEGVGHDVAKTAEKKREKQELHAQNMMIEPEVIKLVTEHKSLFRSLHEAYSDEGDMQWQHIRQLFRDFGMCPRFISRYHLKHLFHALKHRDSMQPSSPSLKPAGNRRRAKPADFATEATSRHQKPSKFRMTVANVLLNIGTHKPVANDQPFGVEQLVEIMLKAVFIYLSFYGSDTQRAASSGMKVIWMITHLRRLALHTKEHRGQKMVRRHGNQRNVFRERGEDVDPDFTPPLGSRLELFLENDLDTFFPDVSAFLVPVDIWTANRHTQDAVAASSHVLFRFVSSSTVVPSHAEVERLAMLPTNALHNCYSRPPTPPVAQPPALSKLEKDLRSRIYSRGITKRASEEEWMPR